MNLELTEVSESCMFCGTRCLASASSFGRVLWSVVCCEVECGYRSPKFNLQLDAIAAHNRACRAVRLMPEAVAYIEENTIHGFGNMPFDKLQDLAWTDHIDRVYAGQEIERRDLLARLKGQEANSGK